MSEADYRIEFVLHQVILHAYLCETIVRGLKTKFVIKTHVTLGVPKIHLIQSFAHLFYSFILRNRR